MLDPPRNRRSAAAPGGRVVNAVMSAFVLLVAVAAAVGWAGGRASTVQERRALRRAATHDPLTGLVNRVGLLGRAGGLLRRGRRVRLAVLFIDLDGFKAVNDVFGHAAGDAVLVQVARRLQDRVRDLGGRGAFAARLSGDEFVAVLALPLGADPDTVAAHAAGFIHEAICQPCPVPSRTGSGTETALVGASIGVAIGAPTSLTEVDRLLAAADGVMYAAKQVGGGWLAEATQDRCATADVHQVGLFSRPAARTAESAGACGSAASIGRWPAPTSLIRRGRVAGPSGEWSPRQAAS